MRVAKGERECVCVLVCQSIHLSFLAGFRFLGRSAFVYHNLNCMSFLQKENSFVKTVLWTFYRSIAD